MELTYADLLKRACAQARPEKTPGQCSNAQESELAPAADADCYAQLLRLLAFCEVGGCEATAPEDFGVTLLRYESIPAQSARLLGKMQDIVPFASQRAFERALERLLQGIPLPYIQGVAEFSDYSFAVGPGVLIPREDSEVLLESACNFVHATCGEQNEEAEKGEGSELPLLELCCGSGCISLSLYLKLRAAGFTPAVWAGDISEDALLYARQSAAYWLAPGQKKEEYARFSLCRSDLFQNPELRRKYKLILANPPYLSTRESHRRSHWPEPMPALEAGPDGLNILRRIIEQAVGFLQPGGALLLEAAPWQMHELGCLLSLRGYRQIETQRDRNGWDRVIGARFD